MQIAVPTRTRVLEYQDLSRMCHELVGSINGKFGSVLGGNIITFLDKALAFTELCALYRVCDVCLVTSLRDGMNLVSYEYIACQDMNNPGVLIVSDFAGSAQSLGAGALRINPWDNYSISDALYKALTMDLTVRQGYQKLFYNFFTKNSFNFNKKIHIFFFFFFFFSHTCIHSDMLTV